MLITILILVIVAGLVYWLVQLLPIPQPFKNIALVVLLLAMIVYLLRFAHIV